MFYGVEVVNARQALILRLIRNDCRKSLVHNSKYISIWQQLMWWFEKYTPRRERGSLHCYLFYLVDVPVGYALVSVKPDGVWISGGLKEEYRGNGIGKDLFGWVVKLWGNERLMLDVFDKNKVAIHIFKLLGFRFAGKRYRKNVIIMRRSKVRRKKYSGILYPNIDNRGTMVENIKRYAS